MDAATLRITLLGGFSVEADGAPVDERAWRLRKARALVKVAALAPGRRIHRDLVAELLWPGRPASAAANNLHQALHAARRALGDPAALTLHDDVLALTTAAWIDVEAFEAAATDGDPAAALALYGGELLPEDRFEEWTAARREALAELRLDLVIRAADADAPAAAVDRLRRAAAQAPRHEPVRRALMRALAADGRRQDALAEFEDLRRVLREHAEADPDPETRALYRELLAGAAPRAEIPAGLPAQLTSFVGRHRELAEIDRMLGRTRLLTLTGPGGAGKTRLALAAAAARAETLPDGVGFVDLGALRDGALVPQAVAVSLGVPMPAQRSALDALIGHLATRRMLIVLDTCEHLLDACAHLAETLMAASEGLRLLATSREPLRCAGEIAWRVPSLAEAGRLFRERAEAVHAAAWTPEEEELIERICHRLDRMPLAVELAAARTGALSVTQLAERLDDSLDVLTAGARTALNRQQTLRATIGWSHDLLTGDERVVFRRLAVLVGAFPLEAAEAVAAGDPIAEPRVADLVGRLVDKSLVAADGERFRLMDAIRQFGEEQLVASGEVDAVAHRHVDWCRTLAGGGATPGELEADRHDLRAALAFAVRADPPAALELATQLWPFWLARSYFVEGTGWLDAVLAAAPERTGVRVEALLGAAALALRRGEPRDFRTHVDEAVGIYRDLGDAAATADALQQHALFEEYERSSARSEQLFADAIAAAERLPSGHLAASAAHGSATTPWQRSDLPGTRARLEEALARLHALPAGPERFLQAVTLGQPVVRDGRGGAVRLTWEATLFMFRRLDRDGAIVLVLNNLAWVALAEEDLDAAHTALDEALGRARVAGDRHLEALTRGHRGHLARAEGDADAAAAWLNGAIDDLDAIGERRDADVMRLGLARALALQGDLAGARNAFAETHARFEATDDLPATAGARANRGLMEEAAGELEAARDLYASAAAAWRVQQLDRIGAWLELAHGDQLHALGDAATAAAVWRLAHDTFTAVFDAGGVRESAARLRDQPVLSGCKAGDA
jgi:predicted ATPase/DNA-binding SARP family transcriptional activator/tetratricopeptide (TPR) repeat protein